MFWVAMEPAQSWLCQRMTSAILRLLRNLTCRLSKLLISLSIQPMLAVILVRVS